MPTYMWSRLPGPTRSINIPNYESNTDTLADSPCKNEFDSTDALYSKIANNVYNTIQSKIEQFNGVTSDQNFIVQTETEIRDKIQSGELSIREDNPLSQSQINTVLNYNIESSNLPGYLEELNNQVSDYVDSGKSEEEINAYVAELTTESMERVSTVDVPDTIVSPDLRMQALETTLNEKIVDHVNVIKNSETNDLTGMMSDFKEDVKPVLEKMTITKLVPSDLLDPEVKEQLYDEKIEEYKAEQQDLKAETVNKIETLVRSKVKLVTLYERPPGG